LQIYKHVQPNGFSMLNIARDCKGNDYMTNASDSRAEPTSR